VTYLGSTEVEGRTFRSVPSLLAWLKDETDDVKVFMKETTDHRVLELVLADQRFLAEARHAFLIRRPEEIPASFYALEPDRPLGTIGLEALRDGVRCRRPPPRGHRLR
jgi:hypothetical protein